MLAFIEFVCLFTSLFVVCLFVVCLKFVIGMLSVKFSGQIQP